MYFTTSSFTLLAAFASTAYAHMEMTSPAPFRSKVNPNVGDGQKDFSMTNPLNPSGANFPCKGYHLDFGTPAGAPTAVYEAGSTQSLSVEGGAPHNGGSCQVSLSYDGGNTFKVIKSILGSCPLGPESFSFTVPANAAAGDAILSWTWFNKVGFREMYQNCAPITIAGSGTSRLDDFPDMFVANVSNGCAVPEGIDVQFPNPGLDVETKAGTFGPPTGSCGVTGAPAPGPVPGPEAVPAPPASPVPVPAPPASPLPSGNTIVVAPGDFCEAIAARAGITTAQLIANNPSVDAGCTNLQAGQVLNLRRRSRIMRDLSFAY